MKIIQSRSIFHCPMASSSDGTTCTGIALNSRMESDKPFGFRYRFYGTDMRGQPGLVLRGRPKAIFVHGCFWHQHEKCADGRTPRSNTEYWLQKLKRNVDRDATALTQLNEMGWEALVVWDCELGNVETIAQTADKVRHFLTRVCAS